MQRSFVRYAFFIIAIVVGIAGGILIGWELFPPQTAKSEPQTLHVDYKTDYVLMVSEIYHQDGDLDLANTRLTFLGESLPEEIVGPAILYAEEQSYSLNDQQLILDLYTDITQSSIIE